jgi:hypothetical protein
MLIHHVYILLANHFLTHTFFYLAISSSSTSTICTSRNLDTFLIIPLHVFLSILLLTYLKHRPEPTTRS